MFYFQPLGAIELRVQAKAILFFNSQPLSRLGFRFDVERSDLLTSHSLTPATSLPPPSRTDRAQEQTEQEKDRDRARERETE